MMIAKYTASIFAILGIAGTVTGCGEDGLLSPEPSYVGSGRVTTSGANQMLDKDFESFDDEAMIYLVRGGGQKEICSDDPNRKLCLSRELETAFEEFSSLEEDKAERRRNGIQDRLIAASNQRCNLFKSYLRRIDSHLSFGFGALATVLGGVGAIVTGEAAARALSGAAGITSGVGSEFRQQFFSSAATQVIIPGIDARRERILNDEILPRRGLAKEKDKEGETAGALATPAATEASRSSSAVGATVKTEAAGTIKEKAEMAGQSTKTYTLQLAIADAIRYHGACTIDTGLHEAGEAIREARKAPGEIGLSTALKVAKLLQDARNPKPEAGNPSAVDRREVASVQVTDATRSIGKVVGGLGGRIDALLQDNKVSADHPELNKRKSALESIYKNGTPPTGNITVAETNANTALANKAAPAASADGALREAQAKLDAATEETQKATLGLEAESKRIEVRKVIEDINKILNAFESVAETARVTISDAENFVETVEAKR